MAAVIEDHKRFSLRVSGLLLDNRAANTLTSSSGHAKNMKKKQPDGTFSPLPASSLVSRHNSNLARNLDFILCLIGMTSNWLA